MVGWNSSVSPENGVSTAPDTGRTYTGALTVTAGSGSAAATGCSSITDSGSCSCCGTVAGSVGASAVESVGAMIGMPVSGSTAFCRCALPQITHADAAMMSAHSERMV